MNDFAQRRAKQHSKPVLPKNHRHPINLINDRIPVEISRAWKKVAVRSLEPELKPKLLKLSLVMPTTSKALVKIQAVTTRVRKDLYESSRSFFATSLGAT